MRGRNRIYDSFSMYFVLRFVLCGSVVSIVRITVRCIVFLRTVRTMVVTILVRFYILDGNGRELSTEGSAEVL